MAKPVTDDRPPVWKNPMAWLPHAIAEAALSGRGLPDSGLDMASAWAHLQERLAAAEQLVRSAPVNRNAKDDAAGMRHLMVLLAVGIDMALRIEPDPVPAVTRAKMDDIVTWGLECPDCVYLNAEMRPGETYRLSGNRGTARYVGLQTMDGMAATANCLVDDLEMDADGNFELLLSADERPGNWLPLAGDHPVLTVRNFLYDWDTETPAALTIERVGTGAGAAPADPAPETLAPEVSVARQLYALGEFVHDNLKFFLDFGAMAPANGFIPPADMSSMGAAAENRPVIGRFELDPGQALIVEFEPPTGAYWSISLGNPWLETINYGRHQSSLNGQQAVPDGDGRVRFVLAASDPGVANWLDTAGHSNGAMLLRCVRTDSAPVPDTRVVPVTEVAAALPADTATTTPAERARVIEGRRRAVHERFYQ